MAKSRSPIVYKEPIAFYGADGKYRKYGVGCVDAAGNKFALLNPSGKSAKYAAELRNNKRYTNEFAEKQSADGRPMRLNKSQRAYRAGYLDRGKDEARAYNAKNGKKSNGMLALPAPAAKPKRSRKR